MSTSAQPTAKRPLRVLCVDDNALLGEVMICLFAKAGHWVEHADDGLSAWDKISRDVASFDVVITDHEMPGLKGVELVALLREASYPGGVIVHSSALTGEEIETYRRLGVESIVMKGARADELLAAVGTVRDHFGDRGRGRKA
jgi:CheY-like chemotaxis protein